jgi:hypothetical protein
MKQLTQEQKAKRYDYIEKAFLALLEERIEEKKIEERFISDADVVEGVMDKIDLNDDIIARGIYLIFDKICTENYLKFMSIGECVLKSYKEEYKKFEEEIGE